jgi:hypothetical protein
MTSQNEREGRKPNEIDLKRRGLFDSMGTLLLQAPTELQLTRLPIDSRVEYFSSLGRESVIIGDQVDPKRSESLTKIDSPYFRHFSIEPLNEKLRVDFKDKSAVGIRGTACSLEEPLEYKDIFQISENGKVKAVKTVAQIIADGTEKGRDITNIDTLNLEKGEAIIDKPFPFRYLMYHSNALRYFVKLQDGNHNAVFPLLLVYNLEHEATDRNIIINAPTALLKAYILDYPYF